MKILLVPAFIFFYILSLSAQISGEADKYPAPQGLYKISGEIVTANKFLGSFKWTIRKYKNGKPINKESATLVYFFDNYLTALRPEDIANPKITTTIIYDFQNEKVTTKIEQGENKSATVIEMPEGKASDRDDYFKLTNTYETKMIDGFDCTKYSIESNHITGEAWVAGDIPNNFKGMPVFLLFESINIYGLADLQGLPIEVHYKNKNSRRFTEISVKEISPGKVDKSIFDLEGYEVMDMSNMWQD